MDEERDARIEKRAAKFDRHLDRLVRLAIKEARQDDERRRESKRKWDELMSRLAAAQRVTEEKLQRYIDERRGANGKIDTPSR